MFSSERYSVVPPAIAEWLRLLRVQLRYPHAAHIWSPRVHALARLGRGCGIAHDVVVNAGVTLGDWSYVSKGAILFSGTIGRFCSVGHYAQIGPENHPLDHLSTSPNLYKAGRLIPQDSGWNEWGAPPIIGSDVWIGAHAIVLQGVNVGDGAVIGSGAVVRADVPPFTIVGGVPASPIRMRFDEATVAQLLELRWWEMSPDILSARFGDAFAHGSRWLDHLPSL
jgi:virginiamycin A acetyltransferase